MVPIYSVVAYSGTGKTTFLEKLIPALNARGLRVAVVKHDGHTFLPDVPGTDTGRFLAAGAMGAAIFDGEKFQLVKRQAVDEAALIAQFPQADLVLLEGFKHSGRPKLEVVRGGNSSTPVCDPATLLALVTDLPLPAPPGVPVLPLGDPAAAAAVVLEYVKGGREHG